MKNFCKISFIPALLIIILSGICRAEDINLDKIVVTPTKTEALQSQVGTSSTVISSDQIEGNQSTDVADTLRNVPGISISQSGSFGSLTDIYIRGAKPEYTLVMIDGVPVNDTMSPGRSFDFAHLTIDNIERIEVIRGPQSTLYGSDAVAGVINVITKKGEGKPSFNIVSEGGTHNTFKEAVAFSGSNDKVDFSFQESCFTTSGISTAKDGTERDGDRDTTFSSRLGYKVFDNAKLNLILRNSYSKTDLDSAAFTDDPNYTGWYKDWVGRVDFSQELAHWFNYKLAVNNFWVERKYRNYPDSLDATDTQSWYKGNNRKFEYQQNIIPIEWNTITFGTDFNTETGSSYYRSDAAITHFDKKNLDTAGYYLQDQLKVKDMFFITPGVRLDDHELFGKEWTYKVSSACLLPTDTKLKFNWGTAFKAPSLYELYSIEDYGGGPIGDPNLKPDKSKSYDLGFEQGFLKKKINFGLTYFYNKFKNMVDYDLAANKYKNIGGVMTKGFEANVGFKPVPLLLFNFNYTYTKAENRDTEKELVRRPKNKFGLDLNWRPLDKFNLNFEGAYVGSNWNNSANTQKVKPYYLFHLAASYKVRDNFEIFGRIHNLFDRKYEEVSGYSTLGRTFYGGIKTSF